MATIRNIDRFKADLKNLIDEALKLELALAVSAFGVAEVTRAYKGAGLSEDLLKKLPAFNSAYEAWYSECLALLKQLLPERLQDFKEHFVVSKNRKDVSFVSYRIQDALKGVKITRWDGEVLVDNRAALPHFRQQVAILKAAERRFDSSLFEIRQLVQADLFDTEVGAARELLKNKFLRAAGAIAGVVLEKHLRQVCNDRGLKIAKKSPGLSDLNELLKSNSVIDVPQWRFISMLADIRNLCDHHKQKEPTEQQVSDLIEGTYIRV